MVGNFAGIVAPMVTGFIASRTSSFAPAFVLAGAMSIIGVLSWWLLVGPVRAVEWRRRGPALAVTA
jgi:hypothetical protein